MYGLIDFLVKESMNFVAAFLNSHNATMGTLRFPLLVNLKCKSLNQQIRLWRKNSKVKKSNVFMISPVYILNFN